MQVKLFIGIVAIVLLTAGARTQVKNSNFCASRTTAAYHSPNCTWGWVVHDPNRVTDVKIPHNPEYHTYSRWIVADHAYIFAYRDIDRQPSDMAADIYAETRNSDKLVGSVEHLGEIVTGVSEVRLTGSVPDVLFRENCGQLQCIVILRFGGENAAQVFRYGASKIEVLSKPEPVIVATSKLANRIEYFAWNPQTQNFRKIELRREE